MSAKIGRPSLGGELKSYRPRLTAPEVREFNELRNLLGCKNDAEAFRVIIYAARRNLSEAVLKRSRDNYLKHATNETNTTETK